MKDRGWYADNIETEIRNFYAAEGIEDIRKSPASVWSACMRKVNDKVIDREDITEHYPLNGAQMVRYNNDKLDMLADLFLEFCERFDKIPTLWGYSLLCGISFSQIEEWCNDYRGLGVTPARADIIKKILRAKECSLEGRIQDGSRNPLGSITTLNRWFGWREPEKVEMDQKGTLALEEIPLLGRIIED